MAENNLTTIYSFLYIDNITRENSTYECYMEQPIMFNFTQVLYSIVCIVGLFGNTLVIYVVLRFSKMQTVTNLYIVNLAMADQCFLIGIPFLLVTMSLNLWPFGNFMCKAYMTSTSINQFTSSIFLTIMGADRYVAICHPVTAPEIRTPFISKIVSITAWSISVVLVIPIFIFSGTMEGNNTIVCNIVWPESENVNGVTAFTLYSFIFGFGLPLFLISIFYSLVVKRLRSVGKRKRVQAHKKVTKLVLTIITVYVFCWLPYWITQISLIFTPPNYCHSKLNVTIFVLAGCLSYSNSAMNPILYAFLSDNFKKSFLKAFSCQDKKNKVMKTSNKSNRSSQKNVGHYGSSTITARSFDSSTQVMKTTKEKQTLVSCLTETAL